MKRSLTFQIPVFITIRTVINTMVRMVYPFLPVLGRGLGVDLWHLSAALTLRSASGVVGPFLAPIANRRGRKAGLITGLTVFTFGAGIMALWPSYPTFVAMLILTIIGNFIFIPSLQAYLGERVAYQRRGLVLGLTELGWSLSFIVGMPLVGLLIERRGWQSPFPILTGLGLLSILTLALMLPNEDAPAQEGMGFWHNFRDIFTYTPAIAGIVVGLAITASNELINVIFGVWMEDSFGVKIATLAATSAVIGTSELGGEILVTGLTDRLGKMRSLVVGLLLNSLAVFSLPWLGGTLSGALVGLFLLYITFEFTIVSSLPLMTEILPTMRATFMGAFIASLTLGRTLGDALAPFLYSLGRQSHSLPSILAIALVATALDLVALIGLYTLWKMRYR